MPDKIDTLIFDLGGVLIDWNPRHLYKKLFADEGEMEYFLTHIATGEWNEEQDAGRSLKEGTEWLIARHPDHEKAIRAFYDRWEEMLGGVITGTVDILKKIKDSGNFKLYALTNWSAETFPVALKRYEFLQWFNGIVVSGEEKIRKPFETFYRRLIDRYQIEPSKSLFIDDNLRNIHAAAAIGMHTVHFHSPDQLKDEFIRLNILPG
jgi:2-haloacid dehalogenase